MTLAEVQLWGTTIAAVRWDDDRGHATFEYAPAFLQSGIEVAPLQMPLRKGLYAFPALPVATFRGLPGLLSDSLPDDFGNALINAWLARQGRTADSFNPVERLCYTGTRGMGALEFQPVLADGGGQSEELHLDELVTLASQILTHRDSLDTRFLDDNQEDVLQDILRVGTSAGGARAKAVIAWNQETGDIRSGQVPAGDGFSYWLLKFDGVSGNKDRELDDPMGFGLIEYAYHRMARASGIHMMDCELIEEGGRHHFVTRRFDRDETGDKVHMQSLGAIDHLDYKQAGAHSYEQAFQVIRALDLPMASVEEQFRRMAFNVIARNQDDHVKNIAFLMDRRGAWSLSPAYDLTYSYNPSGAWTSRHQMSLNGKRDEFDLEDFRAVARTAAMKRGRAEAIVDEVRSAVTRWPSFARDAGVADEDAERIQRQHRLKL